MMTRHRSMALVAAAAVLMTNVAFAPRAVYAGAEGRRNAALLLGGAAAGLLLNGKKKDDGLGAGLALGAAVAYKGYRDKKEQERARAAARWGYRRGRQDGKGHPRTTRRRAAHR